MLKQIRTCDNCNNEMPAGQSIVLQGDKQELFVRVLPFRRPKVQDGCRGLPKDKDIDLCIECFKKEFTKVLKQLEEAK